MKIKKKLLLRLILFALDALKEPIEHYLAKHFTTQEATKLISAYQALIGLLESSSFRDTFLEK